ncbi:MarR family winged helix-turn-helix transcriptional regulator [Massilibacterium senegalense]|uniref:MarR family winged helix-turn-helix transcriptional regulator n=1 Tax=Massilibacterium senegalense TaxID=1632858 RepID=UPI00078118A5|nr:MarR family transcriptional regulator [Massilibacterium senegalense]
MPSNLSLKLLVVFSRASHYTTEKIKEDIAYYGLNLTEFGVLELLYHKGEQPIQQIGKKILLSSGSITYVVDKLENKQLLMRKSCPTDRRVIYAVITEKGKHFLEEIFPKHERFVDDLFSALSHEEQQTMITLCKKIGLQGE